MKQVVLSDGQIAFVDDEDYIRIIGHSWCPLLCHTGITYARASIKINGEWGHVYLHRYIMNASSTQQVDHEDRNGLNCIRSNLRLATRSQNGYNAGSRGGSSPYKGITWDALRKKWRAYIKVDKKSIHLGYFKNEEDAARAYDRAALKYHGEFAKLNLLDLKS